MGVYTWDFTSSATSNTGGLVVKMSNNRAAMIPTVNGLTLGTSACAYVNLASVDRLRNNYTLRLVVRDNIAPLADRVVYCAIGLKDQKTVNSTIYVYRNGNETFPRLGIGSATNTTHAVANTAVNMRDGNSHTFDLVVSYYEHPSRSVELFVDNIRCDTLEGYKVGIPSISTPIVFLGSTGYIPGTNNFFDCSELTITSMVFTNGISRSTARTVPSYGSHVWYRLRLRPKDFPTATDNFVAMSEISLDSSTSSDGSDNNVTVDSSTVSLLTSSEYGVLPTFPKDVFGIYKLTNKIYKEVVWKAYPKCYTSGNVRDNHMVDITFKFGSAREVRQIRMADASVLENNGGRGLVEYFELYHSDDGTNWAHMDSVKVSDSQLALWNNAEYRCLVWQYDASNNGSFKYTHTVNVTGSSFVPFGSSSGKCAQFTTGPAYGVYSTVIPPNSVNYSISMWIKVASLGTAQDLHWISSGPTHAFDHLWRIETNGKMRVYSTAASFVTSNATLPAASNLNSLTWTHICYTWDASNVVRLYVNGAFDASGTVTATEYPSSPVYAYLGNATIANTTNQFYGAIDDVAWHDTALSAAQVTALYNSGTQRDLSTLDSSANVYAWWTFESSSGTDAGPFSRHMTTSGVTFSETVTYLNTRSAVLAGDTTNNQYFESTTWAPSTGSDVSGVTISAWVYPVSNSSVNWVYYLGDKNYPSAGTGAGLGLSIGASDRSITCEWGATNSSVAFTPASIYNEWHHIVATHQRNQKTNSYSLALNGSSQYGSTDMSSWIRYYAFSISAWIKLSAVNRRHTIYHPFRTVSNATSLMFCVDSSNVLAVYGPSSVSQSATVLQANTWYHVACTWDASNIVRLYLNGTFDASNALTSVASFTGTITMDIGRDWARSATTEYLSGNLDHFAYWGATLDASNVQAIYNQGVPFDLRTNTGSYTQSSNLLAYYDFDSTDGTNKNAPSNGSINFTGTNASPMIATGASLFPCTSSQPFTWSVWFKSTGFQAENTNNNTVILTNGNSTTHTGNIALLAILSDRYRFGVWSVQSIDFMVTPVLNAWTHLVFVNRPASNQTALYINGTEYIGAAYTGAYTGNSIFNVGNMWAYYSKVLTDSNYEFNGLIDEVGIWNTALTATQVTAIYNQGAPLNLLVNSGNYTSSSSLQAYWKFDRPDGYDSSPNARHLSLYGSPGFSTDTPDRARDLTLTGSPTFSLDAPSNMQSASFNGSTARYGVSTALTYAANASWTFAFWGKLSAVPGVGVTYAVLDGRTSTDGPLSASYGQSGISFSNGLGVVYTSSTPNDLAWHHYVATSNGTNTQIYEDGVYKSQITALRLDKITIGARYTGDQQYMNGLLEDIAVFNAFLDSSNILAMYNNGLPLNLTSNSGWYTSSANLQAYWRFNGNVNDSTANARNLTATGTFVYSGDTPGSCITRLYLDGSQVATKVGNPLLTAIRPHISIGRGYASGAFTSAWFNGNLDEIGIFSTVLSASDVTAIYNLGIPKNLLFHSKASFLQAYYQFRAFNTAGQIADQTSNGRNLLVNYAGTTTPFLSLNAPMVSVATVGTYSPSLWSTTLYTAITPDGTTVAILEYNWSGSGVVLRGFDSSSYAQKWVLNYTLGSSSPAGFGMNFVSNSVLVLAYSQSSLTTVYIDRFNVTSNSIAKDSGTSTTMTLDYTAGSDQPPVVCVLDSLGKYIVYCGYRIGGTNGGRKGTRFQPNGTVYDSITWLNTSWNQGGRGVVVPIVGTGSGWDLLATTTHFQASGSTFTIYFVYNSTNSSISTVTYNLGASTNKSTWVSHVGSLGNGTKVMQLGYDFAGSFFVVSSSTGAILSYYSGITNSIRDLVFPETMVSFRNGALWIFDSNNSYTAGQENSRVQYLDAAGSKIIVGKLPFNVSSGSASNVRLLNCGTKYLAVTPNTLSSTNATNLQKSTVFNTVSAKSTYGTVNWVPTTQSISVSFWFYAIDPGATNTMVPFAFTGSSAVSIELNRGTSTHTAVIYNRAAGSGSGTNTFTLPGGASFWGAWHHIVALFTNTTTAPIMYIDGSIPTSTGPSARSDTSNLNLGTSVQFFRHTTNQFYCNGYISEVAVYEVALSAGQITALYNSGNPPNLLVTDPSANLRAYWRGTSIFGTNQLQDATGNARHMTLSVSDANYSALIVDNPNLYRFVELTAAPEPDLTAIDLTGAVAAYGLRKVRSAYTGPVARVQRSNDQTEIDVYCDGSRNVTQIQGPSLCCNLLFVHNGTSYTSTQDLRNTSWGPTNNGSFYVSLWAKPVLKGNLEQCLFTAGAGACTVVISKDVTNGNIIQIYLRDNTGNAGFSAYKLPVGDSWWSQWHHFVVYLNVNIGAFHVAYVDGSLLTDTNVSGYGTVARTSATNQTSTSTAFYVGSQTAVGRYCTGCFMEVGVFQGACDASKVSELWNSGTPQNLLNNSNVANLVAYWKMTDGLTGNSTFRNWSPINPGNALTLFSSDSSFPKMVTYNDRVQTLTADLGFTHNGTSYTAYRSLRNNTWGPTNNTSFYVSMWIKPILTGNLGQDLFSAGDGSIHVIINKDATYGNIFTAYFRSNSAGSGYTCLFLPSGDSWWGQWHHFVVYMNANTGTAPVVYCDNVLYSTVVNNGQVVRGSSTNAVSTSTAFTLGCQYVTSTTAQNYFNGQMYEVGVFQGACDASKVAELWNSGTPQNLLSNSNVANLQAYWKLTDGIIGDTARDWTSNLRHLTAFSDLALPLRMTALYNTSTFSQTTTGSSSYLNWTSTGPTYTVTRWYDQTANAKHLVTAFSTFPTTNTTLSAVIFDGSWNALTVSGGVLTQGSSNYTYGIVCNRTGTARGVVIEQASTAWTAGTRSGMILYESNDIGFSGLSGNNAMITPTTFTNNTVHRLILSVNNASSRNLELVWNGNTYKTTSGNPSTLNLGSTNFTIGCNNNALGTERFQGNVYEVIVFNTTPSDSQLYQMDRTWGTLYAS